MTLKSRPTSTPIGPLYTTSPTKITSILKSSYSLVVLHPFHCIPILFIKTSSHPKHQRFHLPPAIPEHARMSLWLSNFIRLHLTTPWPLLIYAATWITLLTFTVAVATFSLQVAFVSAINPSSSFSHKCKNFGSIRMPLDLPGDILCFPAHLFVKSKVDLIVPPVFAAVVVAASACLVRSAGLFGQEQTH